ncbi:hypothetical protein KFK09_027426 [Dendrobium nobile]|uniref:Retrovirus-related Pol polyprotein from transposon TNT 1-94 n=1 Tax=Dendrobium nobile TaxID=94219 RepID=A0A8T3AAF7_DENNO|nr:hypothetical protein KFK09_027426 [Dendrobium nobile]
MATSSTGSQTTENQDTETLDTYNIPGSLKFVISNIKIIANNPLSSDNYTIWRSQVLKLLTANGFLPYIQTSTPIPDRLKIQPDGTTATNPKYSEWVLIDQNLAADICSTVSPAILPYVINLTTTATIWSTLERRLQSSNRSRVIQLKNELHNLQMKNDTMSQYLTTVKSIVDNIAAAGSVLDQEDIILYTLNGLPASYNAFKTLIRTMLHPIDLDDLYSLLISEEINIQADSVRQISVSDPSLALYANRGKGRRGRDRSTNQQNRSTNSNSLQCQICNKGDTQHTIVGIVSIQPIIPQILNPILHHPIER